MNKKIILFSVAASLCICSVSCNNVHIEIPVTTLKNAEDIVDMLDKVDMDVESSSEFSDSESESAVIEGETVSEDNPVDVVEQKETVSFKVVNDIRVCKNINFDTSDKLCTLYLVESGSIKSVDMHQDMTKIEECAIKFKSHDSRYEGWAYINTNGINKERPWEGTIIQESMINSYTPKIDSISGDGFTGSYTQVAIPELNEDGTGVVTVYNDTYASKDYMGTLIVLHLTAAKRMNITEYNEAEIILSSQDIADVFNNFKFIDNTEYKVEEKQFNFTEPITFIKSKTLETTETLETEVGADSETTENKVQVIDEVIGSITTNEMSDFPFTVTEQVVTGQQILNMVEVADKPGMNLKVQNTDMIYKSVNQCKLLSLSYEFTEGESYDIRLFGYLKANSRLEELDTSVLEYDNYYINEEGTGYIIYNIGRWNIRSITTYYVKDRLSGVLVEFD